MNGCSKSQISVELEREYIVKKWSKSIDQSFEKCRSEEREVTARKRHRIKVQPEYG